MTEPPVVPPVPLVIPSDRSWWDAGLLMRLNQWTFRGVVMPVTTSTLLARANPRRWLLAIVQPVPPGFTLQVGPWTDPTAFAFDSLAAGQSKVYTLFQHGLLVCNEWFGSSGGVATVRVVEVMRT